MEDDAGEPKVRHDAVSGRGAEKPEADPRAQKAVILDRRPGEEPGQIPRRHGPDGADESGRQPGEEEEVAPPHRRRVHASRQHEKAEKSVNTHVPHHAGQERADVGRGGRIAFRIPGLERRQPDLAAEAGEGEDEGGGDDARSGGPGAGLKNGKVEDAAVAAEEGEHGEKGGGADMAGGEVDPAAAVIARLPLVVFDKKERRHRHDFPGEEEEDGVPGHHRQGGAGQGPVEKQPVLVRPVPGVVAGPAAEGGEGDKGPDEKYRHEEQGGKGIDAEGEPGVGRVQDGAAAFDVPGEEGDAAGVQPEPARRDAAEGAKEAGDAGPVPERPGDAAAGGVDDDGDGNPVQHAPPQYTSAAGLPMRRHAHGPDGSVYHGPVKRKGETGGTAGQIHRPTRPPDRTTKKPPFPHEAGRAV
ncbi:MAG: hypothetical protein LUG50_05870 [Planctomycetaceae bacterium]|nr:hypothetical protein [Planctomycetaceae bacterium]